MQVRPRERQHAVSRHCAAVRVDSRERPALAPRPRYLHQRRTRTHARGRPLRARLRQVSTRGTQISSKSLISHPTCSLSSTFLRNRIIGALRAAPDPALNAVVHDVHPNFVFEHPTLAELAATVVQLIHAGVAPSPVHAAVEGMKALIAKYSAQLPIAPRQRARARDAGETVLLTGTTGRFGRHVLAQLLADPRVARVYALNRGSALEERQAAAFREAKLPLSLLAQGKLMLLSGDLGREDLGLEPALLAEVGTT